MNIRECRVQEKCLRGVKCMSLDQDRSLYQSVFVYETKLTVVDRGGNTWVWVNIKAVLGLCFYQKGE